MTLEFRAVQRHICTSVDAKILQKINKKNLKARKVTWKYWKFWRRKKSKKKSDENPWKRNRTEKNSVNPVVESFLECGVIMINSGNTVDSPYNVSICHAIPQYIFTTYMYTHSADFCDYHVSDPLKILLWWGKFLYEFCSAMSACNNAISSFSLPHSWF